jgi:hypothetical protein
MVAPLSFFFGFFVELLTSALYHGTHHTNEKSPDTKARATGAIGKSLV